MILWPSISQQASVYSNAISMQFWRRIFLKYKGITTRLLRGTASSASSIERVRWIRSVSCWLVMAWRSGTETVCDGLRTHPKSVEELQPWQAGRRSLPTSVDTGATDPASPAAAGGRSRSASSSVQSRVPESRSRPDRACCSTRCARPCCRAAPRLNRRSSGRFA